jgi:2-oxoglutarate ferredoxin oxidoreductase subunit alpha
MNKNEKFITGNQAIIEGAKAIGANCMCGYPITPATEILEEWAKLCSDNEKKYKMIQAEDETSAGFNTIGAILAGAKAFSATAGPGHILIQDPLSMAEAMRIPFVLFAMQRGGPSTGTVIYGQQEVTLACFGGNGEGLRVVYSISSVQEAYDYSIKAFNVAWQYRFPVIVLGDGYVAKMKQKIKVSKAPINIKSQSFFNESAFRNLRNCFNVESQLAQVLNNDIKEFRSISKKIVESDQKYCQDAKIIIIAHGIVWQSVVEAVEILRKKKIKVGCFRPITLNPFDGVTLSRFAAKCDKLIIIESSAGHLERLVKSNLITHVKIECLQKPVEPIAVEEIIRFIK